MQYLCEMQVVFHSTLWLVILMDWACYGLIYLISVHAISDDYLAFGLVPVKLKLQTTQRIKLLEHLFI